MAVDDQQVVFSHRRARLGAAHFAGVAPLGGVVLYQIGEVVRRDEIVHRDHIDFFAEKPLVADCAKDEAPDAPEAIDADFDHIRVVRCSVSLAKKKRC